MLGLALFDARRLTMRARAPELLRVRKVLRWLKFCRLVAEVRREGDRVRVIARGDAFPLSRLCVRLPVAASSTCTDVPSPTRANALPSGAAASNCG